MAAVDSLRTHLIDELNDLLDAERQLTEALPKLATAATATRLKTAFRSHLKETRAQITRLNQALRELGERPNPKTCHGMKGLLSEGEDVMNKTAEGALRDAVMITSAQKVEHYEMASYGTARTYAQVLGESGVARLLERTLKEEKAADVKLTRIAEGSVNEKAAAQWGAEEAANVGLLSRSAASIGQTVGSASRIVAGSVKRAARSVGLASGRASARRTRKRRAGVRKRARSRR